MKLEYFWTSDLKSKIYKDSLELRKEVFIKEHKSRPDVEICDEEFCEFLAIYCEDSCVATSRIKKEANNLAKIQRVAVRKALRDKGLGRILIEEMEKKCLEKNISKLQICASKNAIEFYKKLGYKEYGQEFKRCGINHIMMEKNIVKEELKK